MVLSRIDQTAALILLAWLATVGSLLGVLLSRVPVYETSRRRHLMLQEVARHSTEPALLAGVPAPQPEPAAVDRPERSA
jgi:hypothetical protein